LRFDLHIHTRYSDGQATITEVMERAAQRHIDVIAITDHALSYKGITPRQFRAQRAELESLRSSFGVEVLLGLEVEMKTSGMEELEQFEHPDILLLSSHELMPPGAYLQAVKNILDAYPIHVLAHHRWHPLYPLDPVMDANLIDLLKLHDVAVELNNRHHLPNDGFLRLCAESGLRYTTGSDAHNAHEVGCMDWSETTARRLFDAEKIYIPPVRIKENL